MAATGGVTFTMKFVPNLPGIEAAGRAGGLAAQEVVGDQILETAQAIAPVDTGAYRDSLYKSHEGEAVVVASDIRYAVYLEFGTSDTPVFATLRQASETAHI